PRPPHPLFPYTTLFRSSAYRLAGQQRSRPHSQQPHHAASGYLAPFSHGQRDVLNPVGDRNLAEVAERISSASIIQSEHVLASLRDRKSTRLNSSHGSIS